MKKFWESIHKKRPQMEKAVKTFERVNTSKGGRAIPEDQRPNCFFFVTDTCVAMKEWVDHLHAETALSSILPCVDEQTTNQTLAQIKFVINSIVTIVNAFANTNPSPGQNFYYNQSRPPMPPLCSPFHTDVEDRECGSWELSIGSASSVWESYICEVTKSDVCTTVGRVTPEIYKQLVAAVNESYALEHYTPPLLSFRDCNFVRDTFESITSDYCPPLERNLRVVNAGLGMISVRVLLCLVLWVFYANRPQREEVFADPHRPQVKDLSSGNGFDNGCSNDETKRYAEVV
ncbi:unnamed protein product [Brassica oleracea]|uniref:Uncharacterized protein n=1 Tax=Brassica oleracea var. oleracea TaxID=109376 RepID=A0A0D3AX23_BRAOL